MPKVGSDPSLTRTRKLKCYPLQVFYASRTHSQLSQFVSEIRKTAFANPSLPSATNTRPPSTSVSPSPTLHPVRVIPLGSRQQLCINDEVREKSRGSNEALGDLCLELQKGTALEKSARCKYLPPMGEPAKMNTFRDRALVSLPHTGLIVEKPDRGRLDQASVHDIEDIEDLGRKIHTCPYYGSRRSVRSAEVRVQIALSGEC